MGISPITVAEVDDFFRVLSQGSLEKKDFVHQIAQKALFSASKFGANKIRERLDLSAGPIDGINEIVQNIFKDVQRSQWTQLSRITSELTDIGIQFATKEAMISYIIAQIKVASFHDLPAILHIWPEKLEIPYQIKDALRARGSELIKGHDVSQLKELNVSFNAIPERFRSTLGETVFARLNILYKEIPASSHIDLFQGYTEVLQLLKIQLQETSTVTRTFIGLYKQIVEKMYDMDFERLPTEKELTTIRQFFSCFIPDIHVQIAQELLGIRASVALKHFEAISKTNPSDKEKQILLHLAQERSFFEKLSPDMQTVIVELAKKKLPFDATLDQKTQFVAQKNFFAIQSTYLLYTILSGFALNYVSHGVAKDDWAPESRKMGEWIAISAIAGGVTMGIQYYTDKAMKAVVSQENHPWIYYGGKVAVDLAVSCGINWGIASVYSYCSKASVEPLVQPDTSPPPSASPPPPSPPPPSPSIPDVSTIEQKPGSLGQDITTKTQSSSWIMHGITAAVTLVSLGIIRRVR